MSEFDVVYLNGQVLLEGSDTPVSSAIGVKDGVITAIGQHLVANSADRAVDLDARIVLPGAVDSHMHLGIYRPLEQDAESETLAALAGGITTVISYFRTGSHYLNRSGSYREIFPMVLDTVKGRASTDYAFHLVPLTEQHLDELEWLVKDMGVASFKFFVSYIGSKIDAESERYDRSYLFDLMSAIAELDRDSAVRVSLSLHCEDPDFLVGTDGLAGSTPLERYSDSRPGVGEGLAVHEVAYLASQTGAPVNILHLSSRQAISAVKEVRSLWPSADICAETTPHYLTLFASEQQGLGGKVNPPLRSRDDGEALWSAIQSTAIDWLATDHCCSLASDKGPDLADAVPGFGGAGLFYPLLISVGLHDRGLSWGEVARLASVAPAKAYGLYGRKGRIAVGADADLAVISPDDHYEVTDVAMHSAQDFTPYSGLKLRGRVTMTVLRGEVVYEDGRFFEPRGEYLFRA